MKRCDTRRIIFYIIIHALVKIKKIKLKYKGELLRLEYLFRSGHSMPILFIPGLACGKEDFLDATKLKSLKPHMLIALDLPGTGNSTYTQRRQFGLNDLVEIINSLVDALDIKKFFLVGHSMGGVVGLFYATKFPEKVSGFINIEGSLEPQNGWWSKEIKIMGFDEFKKNAYPKLIRDLKRNDVSSLRRYGRNLNKTKIKAYFDYSISHAFYCYKKPLLKKFLNLKMPKVFVYGSSNKNWLPIIKKLKKADCLVLKVPKSHHFSFYDNRPYFYNFLNHFIKNQ